MLNVLMLKAKLFNSRQKYKKERGPGLLVGRSELMSGKTFSDIFRQYSASSCVRGRACVRLLQSQIRKRKNFALLIQVACRRLLLFAKFGLKISNSKVGRMTVFCS